MSELGSASLPQRWSDLCAELGWGDAALAVGDDIVTRYDEPQRRYHTVAHLRAVLTVLDELAGDTPPAPATRLAAWFHDVVYDPASPDNEEQSAELARTQLGDIGATPELTDLVADLVLATKSHDPAGLPEADLLLDADLSILGTDTATFDASSARIRQEYAHVPDDLYAIGRTIVLNSFLDRERIFVTEVGRQRFEAQARTNLATELARLSST